jgi:Yip1 domain
MPDSTPGVFADCLEIFYAPRAVFERRKDDPAFGLALLVFAITIVVLYFAFRGAMDPIFDAEFRRGFAQAMKQNPNIKPEMAEQSAAIAKKFTAIVIAGYAIFGPLLAGCAIWLVGKFVGAKETLAAACMIATYSFFPRILETVLNALQALLLPEESLLGRYSVSLGVGRFLNPDTANPLLLAIVGRIDVFTIWVTVLIAIGLAVTGKISKAQAAVASVGIWVVGALPAAAGALRSM